jgi:hypothetical protein
LGQGPEEKQGFAGLAAGLSISLFMRLP